MPETENANTGCKVGEKKCSINSQHQGCGNATLLSEFFAITFLMYFGCLSGLDYRPDLSRSAFGWGLAVSSCITISGHLTGAHLNPCVTIAAFIHGLVNYLDVAVYFIAEFSGALFGVYLVFTTVKTKDARFNLILESNSLGFCCVQFDEAINIYQGMLAEFLATSFLIYAACSIWDPRNSDWGDSVPVKLGLLVAVIVYGIGPLTGAAINPARAVGPALYHQNWHNLWYYLVAEFSAAILTSFFYRYVYLDRIHRAIRPTRAPILIQNNLLYDRNEMRVIQPLQQLELPLDRNERVEQ